MIYKSNGRDLAKILLYYGYEVTSSVLKIVCPFHEDVNPSMMVDLETGQFYCFGCNESGDGMRFVRLMHKELDDLQACKKYFEILKSKNKEELKFNRIKRKKQNLDLLTEAQDYYYCLHQTNWKIEDSEDVRLAKAYMERRGFTPKTLNLCGAKINYSRAYGIIFPMMDNEEFKGWVCRTMDREVEKKRKYLYNEGFSRATTLVGQYDGSPVLYIVEGYMDMLKFRQFGCKNVVAILGWKMSQEQIQKLKDKGYKKVISALDNDECGIKGTNWLKKNFEVVRFCYLKGIKDPGEMTKEMFDKMNRKTLKLYDAKTQLQ